LFTNELFDALPFHRLRFNGNDWHEIYVDIGKSGLVDRDGPLTDDVKPLIKRILAMPGQEVEVRPVVNDVYRRWSNLMARGFVVSIDYGHPRAELTSPRRPKGTWLCYYKHKAHDNPFQNVGDQDITAHVDFTQLAEAGKASGFEPALYTTQGVFFSFVGKDLIPKWLENAASPSARAKKQGALQQILHPEAMGEMFKVLVQQKNAVLPSIFTEMPSRLKRLGV
jgi:SAM-dependent MidA family methyltransferase